MDRKQIPKENRYFSKALETLSGADLKNLQFEKTRQILERAYHQSAFYRDRFDKAKAEPDDFKTLEDIARFPFIEKQDLIKDQEENPPFGSRVCVSSQKIRRIFCDQNIATQRLFHLRRAAGMVSMGMSKQQVFDLCNRKSLRRNICQDFVGC